jgi:tetratricopeptide (TPR) repeat protein
VLLDAVLDVSDPRETPKYRLDPKTGLALMDEPAVPDADAQFAAAFRAYGVDVDRLPKAEVEAALRARPAAVAAEIAASLDYWAFERRRKARGDWRRLVELTRAVDRDRQRDEVRVLVSQEVLVWEQARRRLSLPLAVLADEPAGPDGQQLRGLARAVNPDREPVLGVRLLALALQEAGDGREAERLLRRVLLARPGEAAFSYALGQLLEGQLRWSEAVECYKEARTVRPGLGAALARTLEGAGRRPEALAVRRQLVRQQPHNPWHRGNLGLALYVQGDLAGAVVCYREALRLDPKHAKVHYNLGNALADQGDLKGAVASYKEALRLDPKRAPAHNNLGTALEAQGDLKGAEASYREALRLDPKYAKAHNNLGNALADQGDLKGAVASYKEALRLDPKLAEAHCNLGSVLRLQGRFAASLAAYRRGHELGSRDPKWRYPSAQWVRQAQGYAEREPLLDAVRSGRASPAGPAEFVLFARMSQYTGHPAAAVRLYGEAFALWPQLTSSPANSHRYNGACYAVRAGCGQGQDAPRDEAHRVRLRRQALDWLRADLAAWDKLAATNKAAVLAKMQQWQKDADLAGVRDPEALAQLPAEECQQWQRLWSDVDALLKRARSAR